MSAIWWTELGAVFAPWLARVTLGGFAVSVLTLLAGGFVRRAPAGTRVAVWRVGILALLLLPLISFLPGWQWTLPVSTEWLGELAPAQPISGAVASSRPAAEGGLESFARAPAATGSATHINGYVSTAPVYSREATATVLAGWILLLWALIGGCIVAYFGAGLVALRLLGRRARDVTAEMADLLPADRNVRVLRGGPFSVPGCWGMVRPSVLLPVGSRQWSRRRLRAVLLHETAHLERRDPLFLLLARLAFAVHWVNPLVWRIQRNLLHDGEVACDVDVMARGVAPHEYARVLLELAAEGRSGHQRLVLTMSRRRGLARRVDEVLEAGSRRPAPPGLAAASSLLLVTTAVACATATTQVQPGDTTEAASAAQVGPLDVAEREVTGLAGAWEARYDGGDELYVQLLDGAGGGMSANHFPLTHLGLDKALLRTGGNTVFELDRAAGTVRFEGRFDAGAGHGTYGFKPREDYPVGLGARGIDGLPPARVLLLAVQDVDLSFLDDLVQHTSGPIDGDLLVRAAIFDVDQDFMQEMAEVGYQRLSVQDLVRLRIFDIGSTYVERLRDGGERPTVDELVSRRIREKKTIGGKNDGKGDE